MSTRKLLLLTCLSAPLTAALAIGAHAGSEPAPLVTPPGAAADILALGDTAPLDEHDLIALDGKADTHMVTLLNDTHQAAGISDNQLYSTSTGANLLGQGIFAGSNGISTVIQNTGNQVLIQQTTQVNVLFGP